MMDRRAKSVFARAIHSRMKLVGIMKTLATKKSEVESKWFVVDATDLVLGRLATEVAILLRGKHKPTYVPYLDCGDHVVVLNAAKIKLSANKAEKKLDYRHSGYPGALRATLYKDLLVDKPEYVIEKAIRGMLPKGPLGRQMLKKLKVYSGPNHPHSAQGPEVLEIPGAKR